MIIIHKHRLK